MYNMHIISSIVTFHVINEKIVSIVKSVPENPNLESLFFYAALFYAIFNPLLSFYGRGTSETAFS